MRHKRTGTEEWVTIIDQPTMETAILRFCQQHFQQALQTPFGSGHLINLLGSLSLTSTGNHILNGSWPSSISAPVSPELEAFLLHLAIPEQLGNISPIKSEVSVDEYKTVIKKWKEKTSTSLSGRHLSLYKSIVALDTVQADMCTMLNVVIRCGLVPRQWCTAIGVLLEKDPGRPSINRLRVIHLFEADYNLFLKIFWARRLVHRGEGHQQFGEDQRGSQPGRMANDAKETNL